jgi:hypothetical protein|tara:strand:- start:428 stop:697 length:270 start_codon:yes stop_codon:yes gene_type:complete
MNGGINRDDLDMRIRFCSYKEGEVAVIVTPDELDDKKYDLMCDPNGSRVVYTDMSRLEVNDLVKKVRSGDEKTLINIYETTSIQIQELN